MTLRFAAPNRLRLLVDALEDLDDRLRDRGGSLVVRRGDVVEQTVPIAREVGAAGCSAPATARRTRSAANGACTRRCRTNAANCRSAPAPRSSRRAPRHRCAVGTTTRCSPPTCAPGRRPRSARPSQHRRWSGCPACSIADGCRRTSSSDGAPAVDLPPGGETAGRARLAEVLEGGAAAYEQAADRLDRATSGLSAAPHFRCVSPREVVERAGHRGLHALVRQVAWRDSTIRCWRRTRPRVGRTPRPRRPVGRRAGGAGRLGAGPHRLPVIDAGMRQLRATGWMHNRPGC